MSVGGVGVYVFTTVVTTVWDTNCGDYLLQERPNG